MAVKIVQTILKVGTEISEPAQVEMLLDFIAPLVADVHLDGGDDDEEVPPWPCLSAMCSWHICTSAQWLSASAVNVGGVQA